MTEQMPKRIQRKRTRGWRAKAGALYVGRPTKWGNPFFVIDSKTDRATLPALREKAIWTTLVASVVLVIVAAVFPLAGL